MVQGGLGGGSGLSVERMINRGDLFDEPPTEIHVGTDVLPHLRLEYVRRRPVFGVFTPPHLFSPGHLLQILD